MLRTSKSWSTLAIFIGTPPTHSSSLLGVRTTQNFSDYIFRKERTRSFCCISPVSARKFQSSYRILQMSTVDIADFDRSPRIKACSSVYNAWPNTFDYLSSKRGGRKCWLQIPLVLQLCSILSLKFELRIVSPVMPVLETSNSWPISMISSGPHASKFAAGFTNGRKKITYCLS